MFFHIKKITLFLKEKSILFFSIFLMLSMIFMANSIYFDPSNSIISKEEELEVFSSIMLGSNANYSEIFSDIPSESEIEKVFSDKRNEAYLLLFNDAIKKLEKGIKQENLVEIYRGNQYIFLIREIGFQLRFGGGSSSLPKIYKMMDLNERYSLENQLAIKYYDLMINQQQQEGHFFYVISDFLKRMEIVSPLGILILLISVIAFMGWTNFERRREMFFSTIPDKPSLKKCYEIGCLSFFCGTFIILNVVIFLGTLVVKTNVNLFSLLSMNFPVLFNNQPIYWIAVKFILLIYAAVLFLLGLLDIFKALFKSEYISSLIVICLYLIPFVQPLITFQKNNFSLWNPMTFIDVEMYLSGIRDIYWNTLSQQANINGVLYLCMMASVLLLVNSILANYRR